MSGNYPAIWNILGTSCTAFDETCQPYMNILFGQSVVIETPLDELSHCFTFELQSSLP